MSYTGLSECGTIELISSVEVELFPTCNTNTYICPMKYAVLIMLANKLNNRKTIQLVEITNVTVEFCGFVNLSRKCCNRILMIRFKYFY